MAASGKKELNEFLECKVSTMGIYSHRHTKQEESDSVFHIYFSISGS